MDNCPEDEEDNFTLTSEEKQSLLNAKQNHIRHLVGKCCHMRSLYKIIIKKGQKTPCVVSYILIIIMHVDLKIC